MSIETLTANSPGASPNAHLAQAYVVEAIGQGNQHPVPFSAPLRYDATDYGLDPRLSVHEVLSIPQGTEEEQQKPDLRVALVSAQGANGVRRSGIVGLQQTSDGQGYKAKQKIFELELGHTRTVGRKGNGLNVEYRGDVPGDTVPAGNLFDVAIDGAASWGHFNVVVDETGFIVTDTSTNGTFIQKEVAPSVESIEDTIPPQRRRELVEHPDVDSGVDTMGERLPVELKVAQDIGGVATDAVVESSPPQDHQVKFKSEQRLTNESLLTDVSPELADRLQKFGYSISPEISVGMVCNQLNERLDYAQKMGQLSEKVSTELGTILKNIALTVQGNGIVYINQGALKSAAEELKHIANQIEGLGALPVSVIDDFGGRQKQLTVLADALENVMTAGWRFDGFAADKAGALIRQLQSSAGLGFAKSAAKEYQILLADLTHGASLEETGDTSANAKVPFDAIAATEWVERLGKPDVTLEQVRDVELSVEKMLEGYIESGNTMGFPAQVVDNIEKDRKQSNVTGRANERVKSRQYVSELVVDILRGKIDIAAMKSDPIVINQKNGQIRGQHRYAALKLLYGKKWREAAIGLGFVVEDVA